MKSVITDENKIDALLSRRVDSILPSKQALKQVLMSGKKLRLYQGFDPTGNKLHLGHSIGMRNLQSFAELGHEVIVLFGTGTVLVGDPSQRDTGRKLIDPKQIESNLKTWKDQVKKIIDFDLVTIKYNGDWLTNLTLKDIVWLGSHISAIQLFKRDSFQKRISRGDTVWFHETLYPLLQGYDSVAMDVDLEIGGTDQTFNMLVGRELQRKINNREKYILTNPMVLGTDGKQMSKTSGNCIWLDDNANDMYGKTMSIPDEQILLYMRMFTEIPLKNIPKELNDPLSAKKQLAYEITKQFHGIELAKSAQNHFTKLVQNKQIPDDAPTIIVNHLTKHTIIDLVRLALTTASNSQIKRLVRDGGVELNSQKITDITQPLSLNTGDILKAGKLKYFKIKLTS